MRSRRRSSARSSGKVEPAPAPPVEQQADEVAVVLDDDAAPLLDDDSQLESVWNKQYALQEFVDPKNFKSYDELNAKLNRVLGKVAPATTAEETVIPQQEETDSWTESVTSETESAPLSQSPQADSDDDDIAFFKSLAEED